MASNYTTNYELPLWAADDAFLCTEFNDAHEKIEDALAEVPIKLLGLIVQETGAPQLTLSLPQTSLANYPCLLLAVQLPAQDISAALRISGATSYYIGSGTSNSTFYAGNELAVISGNTIAPPMNFIQLFVGQSSGSGGYLLTAERFNFYLQPSDQGGRPSRGMCRISSLEAPTILLEPSSPATSIPAGTKMALYGLRW